MAKNKPVYVLTLSEYFQSTHPRKGESTHFWEKVMKTTTDATYFPAQCKCGYYGMSNTFEGGYQIGDTGDYSDIMCPKCDWHECDDLGIRDFIGYYHDSELIWPKIHTVRANYPLWKKRIDKVAAGEAILAIRGWIKRPYKDPQIHIIQLDDSDGVGIQKLSITDAPIGRIFTVEENEDKFHISEEELAKNDGLILQDFRDWFKKTPKEPYGIIHFTDFRYSNNIKSE